MSEPNLRVLRPARKRVQEGDVFVMLPPDNRYLFGRVIRARLPRGRAPMPGANLIYIYQYRSDSREPDREQLKPARLLISPLYINQLPWTKGYFEIVGNWPLGEHDMLPRHCFLSV